MSLLDFASAETKNNIDNVKVNILKDKQKLAEELISSGKPKNEVEQQVYKPEKLEKIKFLEGNTLFGKREKICFFITPPELKLLKEKFKVIEQFEEYRIASTEIEKFMGVLLK